MAEYYAIQNFFEWYLRKEYSRTIHRNRKTFPVRRNGKRIPESTFTKISYRNPQRNNPIDQDAQWGSHTYDFALLDKSNLELISF